MQSRDLARHVLKNCVWDRRCVLVRFISVTSHSAADPHSIHHGNN